MTGSDVASLPWKTKKTFFDMRMKNDVGAGWDELRRGRSLQDGSENARLLFPKDKIPLLEAPRSTSQDGAAAKKGADVTTTDDGEVLRMTIRKNVRIIALVYILFFPYSSFLFLFPFPKI